MSDYLISEEYQYELLVDVLAEMVSSYVTSLSAQGEQKEGKENE